MFINPIQFGSLGQENKISGQDYQEGNIFQDVFHNAWNDAKDTAKDTAEKQYLLSIGEIEDTHTVPIAAAKSELAVSLLVSLRNKALDSYNELMRVNV